jgi:hypothetical protein
MVDCEIVENVANGKTFNYCRVHKVEAQDCPDAKNLLAAMAEAIEHVMRPGDFEIAPRFMAQAPALPECSHCDNGKKSSDWNIWNSVLVDGFVSCGYCGRIFR